MLTHEKSIPNKRHHQMIVSRRKSLKLLLDRWILVLLAVTVCAGCRPQFAQVEIDPVTSEPFALSKSMDDKNDVETSSSAVLAATTNQAADPKPEPKAAQSTPTLPAIGPDKQDLIKEAKQKTQPKPQQQSPVVAKKPAALERNGKTYRLQQLNKNQTLLLLAAQPDIRARILASTVREVTTPEQQLAAEQLAGTFDQQYIEILRQRASILETAVDGGDTETKLLDLRMAIVELNTKIRTKINMEILTQDQRVELHRRFQESQK